MTPPEKEHIIEAIKFELGKVEHMHIRQRMIDLFYNVSPEIAERAGPEVGVKQFNGDLSYLENSSSPKPGPKKPNIGSSPALSMENSPRTAKGRKVAILVADGVNGAEVEALKAALKAENVTAKVVAPRSGMIETGDGAELQADENFSTTASVLFDAVYVPGGKQSVEMLSSKGDAVHFVREAFKHCKPVAATGEAVDLLSGLPGIGLAAADGKVASDQGVVTARAVNTSLADKVKDAVGIADGADVNDVAKEFIQAIAQHRFWNRQKDQVPA
jgi:catalase